MATVLSATLLALSSPVGLRRFSPRIRMQAEWVESTVFFDPPVSSRFTPPLSSKQYLRASEAAVAKHAAIIFDQLRQEAAALSGSPLTSGLGERTVLSRSSLSEAAAAVLVEQLRSAGLGEGGAESAALWREVSSALAAPWLLRCVVCDLYKILDVDPAATGLLQPLLYFKGFHALTLHRVAHHLWARDDGPADRFAALRLQSAGERWPRDGREMAKKWAELQTDGAVARLEVGASLFSVDIHPAATIGPGVMLDHASGVVIGGTAVVGSDVYMLHGVTLGATGKPMHGAKRHPTIADSVTLGAGATVLGDILVGSGVTVGASAVVTRAVPEGSTVVGVNKVLDGSQRPPSEAGEEDDYTWFYDI